MTVLSYPFALLPAVIVFGVLTTIAAPPLFALVAFVVLLAVAVVAVVAAAWGAAAALRVVGLRLWWYWLQTAKRRYARTTAPLRLSAPQPARAASVAGSTRSRKRA